MLSLTASMLTIRPRPERPYVLLVDDDRSSVSFLKQVVEGAGYSCSLAHCATEALSFCEERRPQVVVTDLSMPNLDGRGLATWMKTRFPSVPILLMTGQALGDLELVQLKRSFATVFSKPVDIERFLSWIDRLMPPHGLSSRT
ncbi:response regulator [Singulisphaera rosea]